MDERSDDMDAIDRDYLLPDMVAGEELVAYAGEPLDPDEQVARKDELIAALKTVYDPEIPVDIYELGLIYSLDIDDKGDVRIEMTLTAPACPVAGELPYQVAYAVEGVDGVGIVEVHLVWDPPWTMDKMSEDAKLALGIL